ncbi:hypothetical protein CSKR_203826 [Clonorchis sinensis]|uniref:Uncharacterized protein n=1 Tax=Clonorchis sinensis TaxID=79923 RepID=A0A8T1N280_CLOSI|nr:hypothetical protein CSKR_203826 [Clonorchis sinensis]
MSVYPLSTYVPTDYSSDTIKANFSNAMNALLRRAKSSDIVVVAQVGRRNVRTNRLAPEGLADVDTRRTYHNPLLESLPNAPPSDVNAYWDEIATCLHSVGNFACGTTPPGALKHWISDRTVALIKSRRNIPAGPEHNLVRTNHQTSSESCDDGTATIVDVDLVPWLS